MSPITLPIIITIAVFGIIAIVLVKLFYKDKKASDLSSELPPIVGNHWQESFDKKHHESDELENYEFVTKSWEEPMNKKQKLNNGIASKVFQEPMHTKHQDIISNEYQKEDKYTYMESSINENGNNSNASVHFDGSSDDEHDMRNNFERNKENDYEYDSYNPDYNNEINSNNNLSENTSFEDDKENFAIRRERSDQIIDNNYPDYNNNEYITPKKYYSPSDYNNYDNYENYKQNNNINNENSYNTDNNIDNNTNNNTNYSDSYNTNDSSENYNENDSLNDIGGINIGEQIIVGGKPQTIKVGDDIIFNFNEESYSSKILEIKHENIRVKYRAQEKWISFSDIRKVF